MTKAQRRSLIFPFMLALLVFAVTGIVGYRAVDTLVQNQKKQVAARQIAIELDNVLELAIEAETGQRGFVITGDEAYLEPYHKARRRLPESIGTLRQALQGNQAELQRLDVVEQLQQEKFQELEQSIQARRSAGFEAAQRIVLSNRGKALMDQTRVNLSAMEAVEAELLNQRSARSLQGAERAYMTLTVSGALDVALLLFLAAAVRADTRARQQAAQEVANSRTLLNNILDNSPAAIYLLDPQGRTLLANKSMLGILGASREQVIGQPVSRFFADEVGRQQEVQNRLALQQNRVVIFEEVLANEGQGRHFLTSRAPIHDNDGTLVGLCGVSSDISMLKQAEQEIRALNQTLESRVQTRTRELAQVNRQLQQALLDLEAFSYTVAHDLRAPLRGMQGFSEAVLEDYAGQLDPLGQDYLRRIARAAIRMEQLIEDLLTYSQLARVELPLEKVAMQDVLDEVLSNLSAQIEEAKADIRIETRLPCVVANRAACLQILQNLLSNAVKYARPGIAPVVKITIESHLPVEGNGAVVRIWVIDQGIGIAAHQLEKIFLPFERLHGIEEYSGSGIGLAIVARAVKRMHGACGVQSEPGMGSRFWFELPAAQ